LVICKPFTFLLQQNRAKRQRKTISTPQPEYELAVSFAKQLFQSPPYNNYESDLYQHFSTLLSTDTNKITVTKENFRELVTVLRRYPRCELKIVPRLEPQSDQKLPAPAEPSQTGENQDILKTLIMTVRKALQLLVESPNGHQKLPKNKSKVLSQFLHLDLLRHNLLLIRLRGN